MRAAPILLATLLLCLGVATNAAAHAVLTGSSPERGATVPSAPETVEFDFNEAVETDFGAVRVFGPDGEEVQEGEVFHPGNAGAKAAINLKPGLGEGTYTATYRVISADSHPVSGGLTFSVGQSSTGGAGVSELLASEQADTVTSTAFMIARAVLYAALALALGGLVFLARPWALGLAAARNEVPEWESADVGFEAALRRALIGAAVVGLLMTLLTLGLQAAVAGGESLWASLNPEVARELLGTRFGMVWTVAAALWVVFGVAVTLSGRRSTRLRPALLLPPLVLIAAAPALAGHASTQNPVWLLLPLTFIHVVAMACWAGGLMTLLGVVPAATRRLEPADRTPLLANVLGRFSALALVAVSTILVTGIIQAIAEIGSIEALFGSAFGRAILIKFILLLILIGMGGYQRRRIVPAMESLAAAGSTPAETGARLKRVLQAEIALVAVILIVTGALASYSPPTTPRGPESATATVGPASVNLTIEPATIGQNELHFYLSDVQTGDPFDAFKEFEVSLSLPERDLGPLKADVEEAGPGHYLVPAAPLGARGEWQIRMEGLLSKFSEQSGEATVPIR